MSTATKDISFKQNENRTINKRTNRGKRALALIADAQDDYTATVGDSTSWYDEGAIHFILQQNFLFDLVKSYLRRVQPKNYHGKDEGFSVLTEGVYDIHNESWSFISGYTVTRDGDDVTVVQFTTDDKWRVNFILNPVAFINNAIDEWRERGQKAEARLQTIAYLKDAQPLPDREKWAVELVQEFVNKFTDEVDTERHFGNSLAQNYRDHAVQVLVKDIAERFLAVVGTTTLESHGTLNLWRGDEAQVNRVIGVDEAIGIAVGQTVRSLYSDSAVRDLLGHAVEYFVRKVIRGY